MQTKGEYLVSIFLAIIALLVIVGGYASFSGLATYNPPISIEMAKQAYLRSDVFDVNAAMSPATILADETMTVYMDNNLAGVVAIKKYLDENRIEYASEYRNAGENNIQVINLKDKLAINMADLIALDSLNAGQHTVRVELSIGDASAEQAFSVQQ